MLLYIFEHFHLFLTTYSGLKRSGILCYTKMRDTTPPTHAFRTGRYSFSDLVHYMCIFSSRPLSRFYVHIRLISILDVNARTLVAWKTS